MILSNLINACNTFSENLASPEGYYGQVISGYISMAFETVNHWTVKVMAIQSSDTVLEVGFGPGIAIQTMLASGRVGHIVGIDVSPLMLQNALELNEGAVKAGQVKLMEADVRNLPDFGRKFDKIGAINTTMYWPPDQLEQILRNLRKCLVPGGKLFISFQRLYKAYVQGQKDREINGYFTLLKNAGFLDVIGTVQHIDDPEAAIEEGRFVCIAVHGVNPILSW